MNETVKQEVDLSQLAIDRGGPPKKSLRPRRHVLTRYVLPAGLLLGFLSLVAWASWDLVFPPRPVTVVPVFSTTAEVRQGGTPLFQAAGWIEPRPTPVRAAALAPGVVEELLVVEDQPVTRGEAIAELIKDDARLILERAEADLELRQAELDEADAALKAADTRLEQPVHLEASLGEAEAALAKLKTQLKNLPFELRRAEADHEALQKSAESKQAAKGVVAGIAIDIAVSEADAARALVEELKHRAESLETELAALTARRDALKTQLKLLADEQKAKGEAEARVKAAQARVAQGKVALAEAKLQLERMTIVSPIDGRVYRLIAHPGTRVGSGVTQMQGHDGSTVVTLYRPDSLQVRVDVRFEDIPQVSLNQPVEIDNPSLPEPVMGHVLFVSSEADIQKNTLEVKVALTDPPPVFKPEMLVDATFLAPEQHDRSTERSQEVRLFVLQQLIQRDEGDAYVWVADQSTGTARKTSIQTGAVGSNGLQEVTAGLTAASRIISSGSDGLQDGDRIAVTGEDPSLGTNSTGDHP